MKRLLLSLVFTTSACAPPMPPLADFPGQSLDHCAPIDLTSIQRIDVVIAVDTSYSTRDMTRLDLNRNGIVGTAKIRGRGPPHNIRDSDPGDSFLAAEVLAARSLVRGFSATEARFGIVSFTGDPLERGAAAERVNDFEALLHRV